MNRKNILMILPEFGYGGAEKSFCALSVELSKLYNINIVVFNLLQIPIYPIGGEVLSLEVFSSNNWFTKLIRFYKRVIRLRKIKKQFRPKVSISFLEGADYVNLISSIGEKTVCSIRGSKKYDQNISGLARKVRELFLWPFFYKLSDAIVTVNHGIKNEILSYIGNEHKHKIKAIANTVIKETIYNQSQEPISTPYDDLFNNNKTLVTIGRLAPEKGIQLFLPIFKELSLLDSQLKYIIVGSGIYREQLIELCIQLNLSYYLPESKFSNVHQVYFIGFDANPIKYIANADLFIFPSTHEGYPNALVEAIILNKKLVAADCPYGPREIISKEKFDYNEITYPLINGNSILLPSLIENELASKKMWIKTIVNVFDKNILVSKTEDNLDQKNNLNWPDVIEQLM